MRKHLIRELNMPIRVAVVDLVGVVDAYFVQVLEIQLICSH